MYSAIIYFTDEYGRTYRRNAKLGGWKNIRPALKVTEKHAIVEILHNNRPYKVFRNGQESMNADEMAFLQ